jgi:hypothetical protein
LIGIFLALREHRIDQASELVSRRRRHGLPGSISAKTGFLPKLFGTAESCTITVGIQFIELPDT